MRRRIAAALGARVAVEGWRGSLKHRTVELHGVTVGVEPGVGGSFWISIDRVGATLSLRPRASPRLVIESLTLERPRLRLAVGPGSAPAAGRPPVARPTHGRGRRGFALRRVIVDGGELHLVPRSPGSGALAGAVMGITARIEPADVGLRLEAAATSLAIKGTVLPGVQVTGRASAAEVLDLLDSPVDARWTFGSLARGTAATSALRTAGLHVVGEGRARIEDLASLEPLAGALAPLLRLADDGVIDVRFRGTLGVAGQPRLEALTARLELRS